MTFASKNIVSEYEEHQELHRKQAHNQDKSDYSSVTLQIFSFWVIDMLYSMMISI